ncbi:hypothetical protein SCLCIDRAFT_22889 [Scleroderma citrinum Foug A]|uniref:Uncharacterized protein n=1 Tax=Scleroderma citrinum Foug A TaxID=1036808 RepID=A0A0C2ZUA1_9AGAM|nr:hypothetical protein SCLCIDRAFT_22889 [Scleroderma citrinum Foug A]
MAQMELEQILQHMQGHNIFLIRTSESQIHHTGVMPHAWWENPGATLPPGYESHRILEIMEEAQAFFPTLLDGTEALPLLFNVPCMLRDSIKYMISGCDVMLNKMEQEMGRLHGVMQVAEQRLTLFDGFPQVREQLGETWDWLVRDDMK